MGKLVLVNDLMQHDYHYFLTEPEGKNFDKEFTPQLSPKEMLELGVFGGKYMTDCRKEFPKDWFLLAKLNHEIHDPQFNFFKVNASQPLSIWKKKVGYILMIQEVGSNGIVGIIWADVFQKKMKNKLKDGRQSDATSFS